jgi:hypothetical protein
MAQQTLPLIAKTPAFRVDPDKYIREYRLPCEKKTLRQTLTPDGLAVRFIKKPKKYVREYYFVRGGTIVEKIGSCYSTTYKDALKKLQEIRARRLDPQNPQKLKITVQNVFDEYISDNNAALSPRTLKKKREIFGKLGNLKDLSIKALSVEVHLRPIVRLLYEQKKYAALRDFSSFISILAAYAKRRKYISVPLFEPDETLLTDMKIPKSHGFPWIEERATDDLKTLALYVSRYPELESVRNALVFGFCTGLRAENVRFLTGENLKIDDNGEYYLHFADTEMKVEENGDEYIGLPHKLGEWLQDKIDANCGGLAFPSRMGTPLSDGTLAKALHKCPIREIRPRTAEHLVFHSFRKIITTQANHHMPANGLAVYEVERAMSHKIFATKAKNSTEAAYNKSQSEHVTRKVLSWWLNYAENTLGLKI